MGYLPKMQTGRVRPIHMRGIDRCIRQGMTDFDEIAAACALKSGEQVEANLTPVQKMNLGKAKKKKKAAPKKTKGE